VAVYSGDTNNGGATSPFGSEPQTVLTPPNMTTTPGVLNATVCPTCNQGYYPNATSDALTNVAFNENTLLAAFSPTDGSIVSPTQGTLDVWFNDETAMALGVSQITTKTSSGTTTTNYAVSALPSSPGSVTNPQVGAPYTPPSNLATVTPGGLALQGGTDTSGRPLTPSLYVTDITGLDPSSVAAHAGDWQYGGTPIAPNAVYGTWKSFTETIDMTTSTPTITLTAGANPASNGWNLGSGSDAPPSSVGSSQGYGAEVKWNLSSLGLIPGHSYRFYVIMHDGDQNKSGGDAGQACIDVTIPGSNPVPPSGIHVGDGNVLTDSATLSGGNNPTGNLTYYLFAPGVTPNGSYSNNIFSTTVPVNGNGTYPAGAGYTPTAAGTYQWVVVYSGDTNNGGTTSPFLSEPEVVAPSPSLSITKTADQSSIAGGQTAGFTVTIANSGMAAANGLSLSDPLPAGGTGDISWTIDGGTGNPGDFTITGSKGSQNLTFSSFFLTTQGDSLAPGASISVHITSPTSAADVTGGLSSLFNPAGTAAAGVISLGTAGSYSVLGLKNTQLTNNQAAITGTEGVSQGGSLNNGASSSISGNVYQYANGQVTGTGTVGGSIITNATLLAQNDTDALAAATQAAALTATQTFGAINAATTITGNGGLNVIDVNGSINLNNASITLSGTASDVFVVNVTGNATFGGTGGLLLAGGVTPNHVLYNFTDTNNGPGPGTITSAIGNTLDGTLLAPNYNLNLAGSFIGAVIGGGKTLSLQGGPPGNATVNAGITSTLTNTATVTSTNNSPGSLSSSATISFNTGPVPTFDLAITKTDSSSTYVPGFGTTYTIVVTNNGPTAVTGAAVNDGLPQGITSASWTAVASPGASVAASSGTGIINNVLVNLNPGSSVTFTLVAQIASNASGNLTNTATVSTTVALPADVVDSNTTNNSSSVTLTQVAPSPNLVVTNTADQATITPGQTAGYTVVITNPGTAAATGMTLNDPLPAGAGNDINWTIDTSMGDYGSFVITGSVGNQVLTLAPGTTVLAYGDDLNVHLTGMTTAADAGSTLSSLFNTTGTAAAGVVSLGTAGSYSVLGLKNTQLTNTQAAITGTEGVSQGGSLNKGTASSISGNVYQYTSGQVTGPGTVGGSIITNATLLAQNDTDALSASAAAAALAATQTFAAINGPNSVTVTGNGGLNVIDINGNINLNNASLILSGTTSDVFIVNVTGTATFAGMGGLMLAGGVTPNHVLYNFTGTGAAGNVTSGASNVLYGTLLGPGATFNLAGSFIGAVIGGGKTLSLQGGAAGNATVNKNVGFSAAISSTATVGATSDTGGPGETATAAINVASAIPPHAAQSGDFGTAGLWSNPNGLSLIDQLNGGGTSGTATALGNWLAASFPHLYGSAVDPSNPDEANLAGLTNAQVASFYQTLPTGPGPNAFYSQVMATALSTYVTSSTLAGGTYAAGFAFNVTASGSGTDTYNVGPNGAALGLSNNTSYPVSSLLAATDQLAAQGTSKLNAQNGPINGLFNGINTTGNVTNGLTLSASDGTAYSPAQVLAAYGINSLSEDGTGQTIAIVDAYDDPNIFQALDLFDTQFSLTGSGQSLDAQYGPASSFLTVINQSGLASPLPGTDPSGAGTDNWEVEEALDVEWAHAVAPGARIILVEANSQALADLMDSVATAASQPGVSVVSMSWGFPEGQAVFAADEAAYDSTFKVPGVTFVASTGDYGAADPEFPAFSPNVVAVGGTTLNLNADNSYNSETGWGYNSAAAGAFIGSGGGISMYEPEPAYQDGVQSTGSRTTPDVSLIADPATGAWIADPYNLGADNPFEVVGGTSLSAPAWAGLLALVNEGRVAAGEQTLNSVTATDAQAALYSLPQSDYNSITSGFNGYNANAGYNLVTGLGTPIVASLVPDLINYQGAGTTYSGPTVGALQDATLTPTGSGGGGVTNAFNVFSAMTISSNGLGFGQGPGAASPISAAPAQSVVASHSVIAPVTSFGQVPGSLLQGGTVGAANSNAVVLTTASPATAATTPVSTGLVTQVVIWSPAHSAVSSPVTYVNQGGATSTDRNTHDAVVWSRPQTSLVTDAVLDDLAADSALWPAEQGNGTIMIPIRLPDGVTGEPVIGDPLPQVDRPLPAADYSAGLTVLGLAAGFLARGTGLLDIQKRRFGRLLSRKKIE
jgi:uncharacterized repeat protein (TIGR01451 family)/choice-of-anchor A domain-containing protein